MTAIPPGAQKRILLIDDDDGVRDLVSLFLSTEGHLVESAIDGPDGLARIQAENFDLVIVEFRVHLFELRVDLLEPRVDLLESGVDLLEPRIDLLEPFIDLVELRVHPHRHPLFGLRKFPIE